MSLEMSEGITMLSQHSVNYRQPTGKIYSLSKGLSTHLAFTRGQQTDNSINTHTLPAGSNYKNIHNGDSDNRYSDDSDIESDVDRDDNRRLWRWYW